MKAGLKNKIDKCIKKYRDLQDERYNKFLLLDYLTDDEIDIMMSITNRTDGKTYSNILMLLRLNAEFGLTFVLMCRHFTLRKAYLATVFDIVNSERTHDSNQLTIMNREEFIEIVGKGGKTVCCVTDLNSASDLKYRANEMRHYDLIVYDEFIALEHEYLSHEVESLKVIYETMDRESNKRLLDNPKLIFLGNAINFASPVISYYNIFSDIELQEINTIQVVEKLTENNDHLKIAIELRRNEEVNKTKNSKLFNLGGNNYALSGEFTTNDYLLHNNVDNMEYIILKIDKKYLKCYYNSVRIVLNVLDYCDSYGYCNSIADMKKDVHYLNDNYFDSEHIHKMYDRTILYANTYTLQFISKSTYLQQILYEEIVAEIMYDKKQIKKMIEHKNTDKRILDILKQFESPF